MKLKLKAKVAKVIKVSTDEVPAAEEIMPVITLATADAVARRNARNRRPA